MAENSPKEGFGERGSRFFRDVHGIGAVALLGAAVLLPAVAAPLAAAGAFETVHAGGWEAARQHFKKKAAS